MTAFKPGDWVKDVVSGELEKIPPFDDLPYYPHNLAEPYADYLTTPMPGETRAAKRRMETGR